MALSSWEELIPSQGRICCWEPPRELRPERSGRPYLATNLTIRSFDLQIKEVGAIDAKPSQCFMNEGRDSNPQETETGHLGFTPQHPVKVTRDKHLTQKCAKVVDIGGGVQGHGLRDDQGG